MKLKQKDFEKRAFMELLEDARCHLHGQSINNDGVIPPLQENQTAADHYNKNEFFNTIYCLNGHRMSTLDQLTESIIKDKLHKD